MKTKLMEIAKRLKNKKIFMAVASGVVMILLNMGVIDVEMSERINEVLNTLLSVGVAVGIFTNPDKVKKAKPQSKEIVPEQY